MADIQNDEYVDRKAKVRPFKRNFKIAVNRVKSYIRTHFTNKQFKDPLKIKSSFGGYRKGLSELKDSIESSNVNSCKCWARTKGLNKLRTNGYLY